MKALRVVGLWVVLVLGMASSAMAEGFALTEWSARGLGLASGMVGRADDVSAIAYNAAGITQLPGVQVMGGMGLIAPMGTLSLDTTYGKQETTTKPAVWAAPHAYASWQLNDSRTALTSRPSPLCLPWPGRSTTCSPCPPVWRS